MSAEHDPVREIAQGLAHIAPGVQVESYRDPMRRQSRVRLSFQINVESFVSDDVFVRGGVRGMAESILHHGLRPMQAEAVARLGLEEWRDEHEKSIRDEAKRAELELVRSLYAAVRNAPTLEAAQLLLADELEARR